VDVAESVKSPEQPQEKKIVRQLFFNKQLNSPTNSVQKVPPQLYTIQGVINKWFRLQDETNPAAGVAVRHLFQELINGHLNFNQFVRRQAALGQRRIPCFNLLKVNPFI
jgi:hypothetical protein